jgi:hypothetical protein
MLVVSLLNWFPEQVRFCCVCVVHFGTVESSLLAGLFTYISRGADSPGSLKADNTHVVQENQGGWPAQ